MDEEMMMQQDPQAEAGRGTDSVMAHMSLGEIVIPRAIQDDPEVQAMLAAIFEKAGADINEFTVGHEANKINPETGYPEFGFGSFLKKAFKIAAPIALSYFAPGIGTALGSSLSASTLGAIGGGAGGLLSGGGLKGAALGALGGYGMQGGFGSLGSGVQGAGTAATGGAPIGAGQGLIGRAGDAVGLSKGTLSGLTGGAGGGSSFGGNVIGQTLSSGIGGLFQGDAIKKAQEDQLRAQQQQLGNLETFDPSNVTSDAGYQFNLEQGQQGLNRSLVAAGGLQSGAALKAASEYNQKYADNALNSAYQRWANKTGAQNNIYGTSGDIRAQSGLAGAENIARTASGIFNPQPSLEDLMRLYGRA